MKPARAVLLFRIMKHLKPKDAQDLLNANPQAVFIDCRSEMEYFFVGHPIGAQHVAWNDGPDWEINPHFVGQVKKIASMNRPVVLICRSGHRSVDAGLALEEGGFKEVYNVLNEPQRCSTTNITAATSRVAQGRLAVGAALTSVRK
jgi:rhodanese-related sulfurtransferase